MTMMGRDVDARTQERLLALASQLRAFNGHRTVWIDDATGDVVHTEPEAELEGRGYRYVATLLAPSEDELALALADRLVALAAA